VGEELIEDVVTDQLRDMLAFYSSNRALQFDESVSGDPIPIAADHGAYSAKDGIRDKLATDPNPAKNA
jgi:hypothetical protein